MSVTLVQLTPGPRLPRGGPGQKAEIETRIGTAGGGSLATHIILSEFHIVSAICCCCCCCSWLVLATPVVLPRAVLPDAFCARLVFPA